MNAKPIPNLRSFQINMKVNEVGSLVRALFISCLLIGPCSAFQTDNVPPKKECVEGNYTGKQSGRVPHFKEEYIWAVTPAFAKRFCMPEEYVSTDLNGAEAIAYRYKPSEVELCRDVEGKEVCGMRTHSHWLEIYVSNTESIPKYYPDIKYFDNRNTLSSNVMLGSGGDAFVRDKLAKMYQSRRRGEILEPPGRQNPYRGFTPGAEEGQTRFHYIGRMTPTKVQERSAALGVKFYQANIHTGLDLIMLEGWANGNITRPSYPNPPLGFAIGLSIAAHDAGELRYPDGFLHVIELPVNIVQAMHTADQLAGRAFDEAVRDTAKSMRSAPTGSPTSRDPQ